MLPTTPQHSSLSAVNLVHKRSNHMILAEHDADSLPIQTIPYHATAFVQINKEMWSSCIDDDIKATPTMYKNRNTTDPFGADHTIDSMATSAKESGTLESRTTQSLLSRVGKLFRSWFQPEPDSAPLLMNDDTEAETTRQKENRKGWFEARWVDKLGLNTKGLGL